MTQVNTLVDQVVFAWQELQKKSPLIQCITNQVASNYAANVLLACGASPAMIDNPYEAESFTRIVGALSINLGTPSSEQMQAMKISSATAHQESIPWVLDPVGYSPVLKWRSDMVDTLLTFMPSVIRGNASEISTLAGEQSLSKGVDSTLNSEDVYKHAKVLLKNSQCVAISGPSDFILSQESDQVIEIKGGSILQPRITATGCSLGALIAAYCAVAPINTATIAAHVHFAIAGKLAYEKAPTLGQFNVAFMDELFTLNAEKIKQHIDIQIH
ncbi:hydroxyethylthiazole kinase [Acinetobacter nectaris]|uniref:hydroxyethylthiazole kinase n=1 Tax=Acinetobacter nectaris TaxID=1219382 RepID=UPI001F009E87|nr:hydroxyethylthiazole kinase [Acinetobacter nectaris]MCF9033799.1 hydroxyethylthiazole kinase [Acinetobacter nectaris]